MRFAAKILVSAFAVLAAFSCRPEKESAAAQDARIYGVYRVYPAPDARAKVKAPRGYRPVYVSHYGRHGSRWILYDTQYVFIKDVLDRAAADGKLTCEGKRAKNLYDEVYPRLAGRAGQLTPLGMKQHREIASRMAGNYPEIFAKGSGVMAFSSDVPRTILSMGAFCGELQRHFPEIEIYEGVNPAEYEHFLNPYSSKSSTATAEDLRFKSLSAPWREDFDRFCKRKIDAEQFCGRLFTDLEWLGTVCRPVNFERDFYYLAVHMDGVPAEADFLGFFLDDELESLAECDNYTFYVEKGPWPGGNGRSYALSVHILDDIVGQAARDMASGDCCARLRFGHDGCLMGLLCLMGVKGWCEGVSDPDRFTEVWNSSEIPMAANIQFIFFRNRAGALATSVLFNEKPLGFPLPEISPGCYDWEAMRSLLAEKSRAAHELLSKTI